MQRDNGIGITAWAVIVLFCLCCHLGLALSLLPAFDSNPDWSTDGERLLTTPDGYYYMRLARDWADGRRAVDDPMRPGLRGSIPPLPKLTAIASELTATSIETTAFFMAPALAALAVIPALLFGAATRSWMIALMAGLAVPLCEVWFARTTIGSYDTDCLILPLWFSQLYCLFRLDRDGDWRWLPGVLAAGLGLALWWPHAGFPFALLALLVWAGSIVLPAPREVSPRTARLMRRLKALTLLGAILGVGLALAGVSRHLPGPLGSLLASLESHLRFTMGEQQTLFTQTGWTIEELTPVAPLQALGLMGAHWSIGLTAVLGLILLAFKHPRVAFFGGLPSLIFLGAAMLMGNRFLMFSALALALGLAWLCAGALPGLAPRHPRLGKAVGCAVFAIIVGFSIHIIHRDQKLAPTFNARDVALARTVDFVAGPRAAIWNWWGPGYLLQYYAKRQTFFDGGLQGPEQAFIAARPLAAHDPLLARNWIKFFSTHPRGLDRLTRQLRSKPRAVAFLEAAFALPQDLDALVAQYGLDLAFNWRGWLFPQREVYLVLYADMLLRNTWLGLGSWSPQTHESPKTPFYAYDLETMRIDRGRGIAVVEGDKIVPYSALYHIAPTSLSHDPVREHGSVLLTVAGSAQAFMVPEYFFHALTFQLLYVYPESIPGFRKVAYNPYVGGVWRVE